MRRSVQAEHHSLPGNWQSDHRTWQQRGGYSGYRIPDNRFHGYFGPSHGFRIEGLPFLVVGGYPRFQYGGYWFSPVDPWPEYWANNWYDTDDVYIAYADNGYYLFNRRYPNVGIAISISASHAISAIVCSVRNCSATGCCVMMSAASPSFTAA